MSTREPLIYPMPQGYELGALVQQIADHDEPRAVILDFLQKTILVHPQAEDGIDIATFSSESLVFLLSSVELEHVETTLQEAVAELPEGYTSLTLCANPSHEGTLEYNGDTLWTPIIEPNYALLAMNLPDQTWRLIGVNLPQDRTPATP